MLQPLPPKKDTKRLPPVPGAQSSTTGNPIPDYRPQAAAQRQLIDAVANSHNQQHRLTDNRPVRAISSIVQKKTNNTGLPTALKTGIEQLSGLSMDDVKVHYNSAKPAQLQAHAYAQGTNIYVAPGQQRHLPHEAWHVAQQKQGRVRPTIQLKTGVSVNDDRSLEHEADMMGEYALANNGSKAHLIFSRQARSENVLQRQIILNARPVDKSEIIDSIATKIKGRIHGWLTTPGMTAIMKKNPNQGKEEVDATTSNVKATAYLNKHLVNYVTALLSRYDEENRNFLNDDQLETQLIQDVKLHILDLDDFVGVEHHKGQFSTSDASGRSKPLRIYRTTTKADWLQYLTTQDIGGLLHGHGGSLGQALDYFHRSRKNEGNDNVVFELQFANTAANSIDYTRIISGGEGGGPESGKLTGKKEKNDIFSEDKVFSVNLTKSKDLILGMHPTVKRVDNRNQEVTERSETLVELKHNEDLPRALPDPKRTELGALRHR